MENREMSQEVWGVFKPSLSKQEEFERIYKSYDADWSMKDIIFYIVNSAFTAAMSRIVSRSPFKGEKKYSPIELGCSKVTIPMNIMNKLIHNPKYRAESVEDFRHKISDIIHDIIELGYVVRCAYMEFPGNEETEEDPNAYFTIYVSAFDPADYAEEASTFAMASRAPRIQPGSVEEIEAQIIENMKNNGTSGL